MTKRTRKVQTTDDQTSPKAIQIVSVQESTKCGHVIVVLQENDGHDLLALESKAGPILATLPPSIQKAPSKLAALLDELLATPSLQQSCKHYWIQPGHQVVFGKAFPVAALVSAQIPTEEEKIRLTELVLNYIALLQKPADQRPLSFVKKEEAGELEEAAQRTLSKFGPIKLHAPVLLLRENGEKVSELKGRLRAAEPIKVKNKEPSVKPLEGQFDGYCLDDRIIKIKHDGRTVTVIHTDFDKHRTDVLRVLEDSLNPYVKVKFQEHFIGQATSGRFLISIELKPDLPSLELN